MLIQKDTELLWSCIKSRVLCIASTIWWHKQCKTNFLNSWPLAIHDEIWSSVEWTQDMSIIIFYLAWKNNGSSWLYSWKNCFKINMNLYGIILDHMPDAHQRTEQQSAPIILLLSASIMKDFLNTVENYIWLF